MKKTALQYQRNVSTFANIYALLTACDLNFVPALSTQVNIHEYAQKLWAQAVRFEAWDDSMAISPTLTLVGIVACYFTMMPSSSGYITSVCVTKELHGQGVAVLLMQQCLDYGQSHGYREILLEVGKDNYKAIRLYKKYNFAIVGIKHNLLIMKKLI